MYLLDGSAVRKFEKFGASERRLVNLNGNDDKGNILIDSASVYFEKEVHAFHFMQ